MATTTLRVGGMTCGACTSAVESGVLELPGVADATVSLVLERCVVTHDESLVSPTQVQEAIEDRGFDAEVLSTDAIAALGSGFKDNDRHTTQVTRTTISIQGMTCGACTSAIQGALEGVTGVANLNISLLSERAVVEHDAEILTAEQIAEMVEDVGFDATVLDSTLMASVESGHPPDAFSNGKQVPLLITTLALEGITCSACTSAIEAAVSSVEGVAQLNISLLASRCVVIHDRRILSPDRIIELIDDCGFSASLVSSEDSSVRLSATHPTTNLKIYGLLDDAACQRLEKMLCALPGISTAIINASTFRASVSYSASAIGLRAIVRAVEDQGYSALVAEVDDNNAQLESLAKTKEIQRWRRDFFISLSFAIPVFCTSMLFPMCLPFLDYGRVKIPLVPGLWLGDFVCLWLTIPVQFGIGRRFYVSAFKSLRHRSPTMDVLVVLGTSAAFFFSVATMAVSILTPPHSRPATVFDTSTMLITFITLGRYLENRAKGQTSRALSRLMSLAPSMASIYVDPIAAEKYIESHAKDQSDTDHFSEKSPVDKPSADSSMMQEEDVATELVQTNDIVVLRPGAKIPADGFVIRGRSWVNEGMISGEAKPVLKVPGSSMMAGTVNGEGRLDFKVTRAGSETQLSEIVKLVARAQATRAPIQRLADKVAGYFVPVIISLGLFTFFGWMVLSHILPHPPAMFMDHASGGWLMVCLKLCISVIVFACPCALGLSTPTAVMVGTGVGAEQGILFKGGEILETANKITHVFFDKTGTLTSGKMTVSHFTALPPPASSHHEWESTWWTIVGLAEMSSEHPIGHTIVLAAKSALGIDMNGTLDGSVDDFEMVIGKGVSATVTAMHGASRTNSRVLVGNVGFLQSRGVQVSQVNSITIVATVVYVAIDERFAGYLLLSDSVKSSAAATIAALARMGIQSSMVTGDAAAVAQHVASLVDIPTCNVHASCSPEQKQSLVMKAKAVGEIVAMVGDGINDAVALSAANVGISFSSATGVAVDSAQIVLMRDDDLLSVPAALHLSRAIFSRIKGNLIWACAYNIIGLPFAMGLFLPWGFSMPPMMAGAAMALSSVSVVMSSLTLKLWKRPSWMHVALLENARTMPRATWTHKLRVAGARIRNALFAARQEAVYVPLSAGEERV